MKIAVFLPALDNIGGSEMVALQMAKNLDADVYTTNINSERIKQMGFSDLKIYSIGKVPINPPYKLYAIASRFRKLKLKKNYDVAIIHLEWLIPKIKNAKIFLYSHTPSRGIWDLYYATRKSIVFWKRPLFDLWTIYNRYLNFKFLKEIDKIVCNSINSALRFKKFLNINVKVIYPPIEVSKYTYKKPKNYWLSVNRLIQHKRIGMQFKAFEKLPNEKLIVVGSYEDSKYVNNYRKFLKKIKPKNVEILSFVDDKELIKLYSECKGLITTAKDEDFGLTPLEAMASGKPVIAPNEGGYKETVINGVTGILIDDINPDKLADTINLMGKNPEKYKTACIKQAKKFDIKIFIKKIKNEI